MTEFEQLMRALGEDTGAAPFEKNDTSGYTLVFDNLPGVDFHSLPGNRIVLKARISGLSVDGPDRDRLLKDILKINLARARQQQEAVSYEAEQASLWLHTLVPSAHMPVHRFQERVADFVNCLEFWCRAFEDLMDAGAGNLLYGMPSGPGSPMIAPEIPKYPDLP